MDPQKSKSVHEKKKRLETTPTSHTTLPTSQELSRQRLCFPAVPPSRLRPHPPVAQATLLHFQPPEGIIASAAVLRVLLEDSSAMRFRTVSMRCTRLGISSSTTWALRTSKRTRTCGECQGGQLGRIHRSRTLWKIFKQLLIFKSGCTVFVECASSTLASTSQASCFTVFLHSSKPTPAGGDSAREQTRKNREPGACECTVCSQIQSSRAMSSAVLPSSGAKRTMKTHLATKN
jgi:hypothetical protein